ncbi:MAG: type II toxin-antitoxin system HicB family antitoxin [Candidatus Uhrbacteria bacterium]
MGFYNVMFRKEPEGGYTAIVPSLPGCVTYGRSLELAKQHAEEAIELYIVSLKKHGESIPSDETSFFAPIRLNARTRSSSTKRKAYAA